MTSLIKYEAACRALAEAKAVDEVKDLRDKADALRVYAMQARNRTLEVDAAEIRIRAERRLGEMIAAQKADGGLSKGAAEKGANAVVSHDRVEKPKLSDAGISKDLSSHAQKLAAVPESQFEEEIGEWRDRVQAEGARVTTRLEQDGESLKPQPEPEPQAGNCAPSAEHVEPEVAPAPTQSGSSASLDEDAFGGFDAVADLEIAQKEIILLQEQVAALSSGDVTAELEQEIKARQGIEARLAETMNKVSQLDKELRRFGKLTKALRDLLGVESNAGIVGAVRTALAAIKGEAA
jgi:hypothetical protein